jgi:cyclophilin family peptidyl-prolyl cis-trans isomerase
MARPIPPLVVLALLAACGKDGEDPAPTPGEPAREERPVPPPAAKPPPPWEKRSDDPAIAEIQRFVEEQGIDRSRPNWRLRLPRPPKATFPPGKRYFWLLETNRGPMRIRLRPDIAPMHVSSAIYLTVLGFYDGLTFHRVIAGFMAQGGDPVGDGTGEPGYLFDGELDPDVRHDRAGVLSSANKGPGSDGSQFFLLFAPQLHLDMRHTIYGQVVDGMDTLRAIEALGGPPEGDGAPRSRIVIQKATITAE